jgi:hypothetical protein
MLTGFRNPPHAHARAPAEAAAAQGEFWRMHELLFAHQKALEIVGKDRFEVRIERAPRAAPPPVVGGHPGRSPKRAVVLVAPPPL